jgi:hypothetical protein
VQTKVLHLRGRLCHIEVVGQPSQQFDSSRIKQVRVQLETIEGVMAAVEQPDRSESQAEGERSRDDVNLPVDSINPAPALGLAPVILPPTQGQVQ